MTTIQDIADKMGVSKSTVSKALNDAPDISEALRKQVLETAVALGYTKLRRYKKKKKKVCIIIEKGIRNRIILPMISWWVFVRWQNLPDLMLKLYPLILRHKETGIMMFLCWSMII